MKAHVIVMPDGLWKILLTSQDKEDKQKIRELLERGFPQELPEKEGTYVKIMTTLRSVQPPKQIGLGFAEVVFSGPAELETCSAE